MIYAGDTYNFLFSLSNSDGSSPNVTTAPMLVIIRLSDGQTVVSSQVMSLVSGSTLVYSYAWNTVGALDGDYLALVSYAADGNTFNGKYLDRLRIGDSRVTGLVALDSTVAHDATVAKDATVAHVTDLTAISPNNSSAVLAIKAKTDSLPTNPASQDTLTQLLSLLTDVYDASLGTWTVDKTQTPRVLTFKRLNGSVLATFTVTEDSNAASRTAS